MLKHHRMGPSEAPRLVLLNALGSTSNIWRPLVSALQADYELILLEFPGFAGSPPEAYASVTDLSRMVAETLSALPEKPHHIVGYSFGSWVGQHLALEGIQEARSLILLGSAYKIYELGIQMIEDWLRTLDRMGLEAMLRQLAFWSFSPATFDAQPSISDNYVQVCLAGCKNPEMYRYQLQACTAFRNGVALNEMTCPTLILRGEHDIFYPKHCCMELRDRIPGSRWEEIPRAGHAILFENPGEVLGSIKRFLDGAAQCVQ